MLKSWMFWLPAVYLAGVGLTAADIAFHFTGSGEANLGIWIFALSFIPLMAVAKTLGVVGYTPDYKMTLVVYVAVYAAILCVVGAMIDRAARRSTRSIGERAG